MALENYQSCLVGFEQDNNMKETMQKGIVGASELTSNALTILTKLSDILSKFDIQLNITNSHRLISVEKNEYPSWFLAKGSHILARIDNSNLKPNVVMAKDGNDQFKTISVALVATLKNSNIRHSTTGPERHQAVALCIQSSNSTFFNCKIDAYQVTLYNQTNHQFFSQLCHLWNYLLHLQ
ncbi:pectinesterase-like [Gossypium australe]|uniref:Pectinesterase-like n=1 Tax=Gossypium australe TaxID=47621 RepID=A0A5B6W129_9ROSI|nr:pectinesterase-like [Gossypium australe]